MENIIVEILKIGGPPVAIILALAFYNRFISGKGKRKTDSSGEPEERRSPGLSEQERAALYGSRTALDRLEKTFMREDPETGAILCLQTWKDISDSQKETAQILHGLLAELKNGKP